MSGTDQTRPSAGGSYIIRGGKLELQERTIGLDDPAHPDHISKRDALAESEPAESEAPVTGRKER